MNILTKDTKVPSSASPAGEEDRSVSEQGAPQENAGSVELKALQYAIYADKVRRARAMTPTERLDEALELGNDIFTWMLDGAKAQCGFESDEMGWAEVERRLQILRRLHEHKLYKPVAA